MAVISQNVNKYAIKLTVCGDRITKKFEGKTNANFLNCFDFNPFCIKSHGLVCHYIYCHISTLRTFFVEIPTVKRICIIRKDTWIFFNQRCIDCYVWRCLRHSQLISLIQKINPSVTVFLIISFLAVFFLSSILFSYHTI